MINYKNNHFISSENLYNKNVFDNKIDNIFIDLNGLTNLFYEKILYLNSISTLIFSKRGYIDVFTSSFGYTKNKLSHFEINESSYLCNRKVFFDNKQNSLIQNNGFDTIRKIKEDLDLKSLVELFNIIDPTITEEDIDYKFLFNGIKKELYEFPNLYYKLSQPVVLYNKDTLILTGYMDVKGEIKFFVYNFNNNINIIPTIKLLFLYRVPTSYISLYILDQEYKKNNKPMYRSYYIPKKDGSKRLISAPNDDIKKASKSLLIFLEKEYKTRNLKKFANQFAYSHNLSIKDNVEIHENNEYVIKFDISKFFDNCKFDYFERYLLFFLKKDINQNTHEVSNNDIIKITNILSETFKSILINPNTNGLYMGNPVSGILSNMIMHPVALYLKNIAAKDNISFSIYADDITFSINKENYDPEIFNSKKLRKLVNFAFKFYSLDFKIKNEKTRFLKNNGRRVTGVRINHENKMTVDRYNYSLFKSICEHLEHGKKITMNKDEIQGKLNYYLFIDKSGKFKKLINKYYWVLTDYGIKISKSFTVDLENPGQICF